MGHKKRVQNQQLEIMKLISETKMKILAGDEKAGETCFLTIDYKMKFTRVRYRETTIQYCGKAGMLWHGIMVHYYVELQNSESGLEKQTLYLNHIPVGLQDEKIWAVLSIMEHPL